MSKNKVIIGIDPGLERVGFSILKNKRIINFGVITTNKNSEFEERIKIIGLDIKEILEIYKPDIMIIEKLFFIKNITNGIEVAHARGVIIYEAIKRNIKIIDKHPKDVKMSICGYGNATKKQVQLQVKKIFNLKEIPKPDDSADAIAIAYCGF